MRKPWLGITLTIVFALNTYCKADISQFKIFPPAPSPLGIQNEWPKVTFVSTVAADILEVHVQTGFTQRAEQQLYKKRPQDYIRSVKQHNGHYSNKLHRDGKLLGYLVGKDDKFLFKLETVVKAPFDADTWENLGNLLLSSKNDPNYTKSISAVEVYRKTRPLGVARIDQWKFDAPLEHIFYLKLPKPLTEGKSYQLLLREDDTSSMLIPSFTYDSNIQRSEAVHVSQIGFRPDDPVKVAFASTWTGSRGIKYDHYPFHLIEQNSGTTVFNGKLAITVRADQSEDAYKRNYSGTDVYIADFSQLNKPGEYRVCVEGVGCSFPFNIEKDVWTKAFKTSAKGFYTQRRSIEIGPPYSKFKRPRNLDPRFGVTIYQSKTPLMDTGNGISKKDKGNFGNLTAGKTAQRCQQKCWGGLMDAGDWDSRIQHLIVTTNLLELFEINPSFFSSLDLNIPESNNDLPDIIDEALFNLDHYRRMQTPDGGIRGGVESEEHPLLGEASWQESQVVFVYAPGIWSSYLYAAAAARTAHVLHKLRPALAPVYQYSAVKAWQWAERKWQQKDDPVFQIRDARNYAAAALFRLTGEAPYHKVFRETTAFRDAQSEVYRWNKIDQREANWLYIDAQQPGADKKLQENCRIALFREADMLHERTHQTGFRWARDKWAKIGWGAFTHPEATSMVRAHRLTGNIKYLRGAIFAAQSGAGANPLNMVYTTGLGIRFPKTPLHVDSYVTQQKPPPGLTLFGPIDMNAKGNDWLEKGYKPILHPFLYPKIKSWPTAESFWDMTWFPAVSEYTVHGTMAENAYVWGYLAARE